MRALTFACYVGVFATCIIAYTYATVGGQYSVNVHFVPPLVTASCQIAQFWSPPNVTCALCFCMTGSLSRCIPQPGCSPLMGNSTNTNGTTTTEAPHGGNGTTAGTTMPTSKPASGNAPADPNHPPTSTESSSTASQPSTAAGTPASSSSTEASSSSSSSSESTTMASSVPGKLRAAKPGKSRRRRHA